MTKKPEKRAARRVADLAEFRSWLAGIDLGGISPSLHVNGHHGGFYLPAVLTVDFGQPLRGTKPSPELVSELISRMRRATRDVLDRDPQVRVHTDGQRGIFWASAV